MASLPSFVTAAGTAAAAAGQTELQQIYQVTQDDARPVAQHHQDSWLDLLS